MQLFLDCDGVLADFDLHAEQLFGQHPRKAEAEIGSDEFWSRIHSHGSFYRNLPLMPDARKLFDAVAHLNPVILTGCPPGDWSAPQKVEWAAEHFPGTHIITCLSREKSQHMQPGDVLVDDYTKYKDLWESKGGIFVHYISADQTIQRLTQLGVL